MKKVTCGLIQMGLKGDTTMEPRQIRELMLEAHHPMIEDAAARGVQVLCFQEVFTQPYFCPGQDRKWYAAAEAMPEGPTTQLMQEYAKRHNMVIVVPTYEETMPGVYYNTAAVFDTAYCKLGVYICYDRHFPEGWRALALNGAEYIVNPSATVAGLSKYLWELEQPAAAAANGVYIGAINRVGTEEPWASEMGEFYGSTYIVNPRGQIEAQASYGDDELLVHEIDLDMTREVRDQWQFYRDRRPETYGPLVAD